MISNKKFLRFAERELLKYRSDIIINVGTGYEMFGRYRIMRDNHRFYVFKDENLIKEFTSLRTASSWCVADRYQQSLLAKEIQRLDDRMAVIEQSLRTRQHCRDHTHDSHKRCLLDTKISGRSQELNMVAKQLEKCVWRAKYLQFRGFHNDTQRHNRHYA